MTRAWCVALVALLALLACAGVASADRLTDKGMEQHGKQLKAAFDVWQQTAEKAGYADPALKAAAGAAEPKDLVLALGKALEAFNEKYRATRAANAEADPVIRKASDIERAYRAQASPGKAAWAVVAPQFKAFAYAYGVNWPIEQTDPAIGRLTDKELMVLLDDAGKLAKKLKGPSDDAAKKSPTLDKTARETMSLEFDSLGRIAKQAWEKMKYNDPADTEERQVLAVAYSIAQKLQGLELAGPAKADWQALDAAMAAVARAFNDQWLAK
jgi:hypothetical protein